MEFAKTVVQEYVEGMRTVDRYRSLIDFVVWSRADLVEEVGDCVIEGIRAYLGGHPAAAFSAVERAFSILGPHIDLLKTPGDMSQFVNPMYRMRSIDPSHPFEKADLFHIPFELRHIVRPMRYSINGLPCLYLGGSTYVCWKELGEPDLESLSVSRFEAVPGTNLKVLNFGHRMPVLAAWIESRPDEFEGDGRGTAIIGAHVACWPVVALCSIRKLYPEAAFHPEYILPQLVLQWVTRSDEFHGIRYFSTHYTDYHDDPKTYMNYVFPARQVEPAGRCPSLTSLFRMTSPVPWGSCAEDAPSVKRPRYKYEGELLAELEHSHGRVEDALHQRPTEVVA